jgi:hypothetical protein
MTTLSVDKPRAYSLGEFSDYLVIASDIIYEGAAVGDNGAGYARPLAAGDKFLGFCTQNADNSAGAAGAIRVRTRTKGSIQLAVTGAVITDVGQPVYASDDDTFVFTPTSNSFVGIVRRFVSSGIVIVEYDPFNMIDPYGPNPRVTKSANATLDATYSGETVFVDTDTVVITLPAVEGICGFEVVNIAPAGTALISVAPNASDMIEGPGITAADNKAILNTKATAKRGDFLRIEYGDANGWAITDIRGTWVRAT